MALSGKIAWGKGDLWIGIIQQLKYNPKWYVLKIKHNGSEKFIINNGDIYSNKTKEEISKKISEYLSEKVEFEIYVLSEELAKDVIKELKKYNLEEILLNL